MVTKLVIEIHALCNKNEISSQKCNVTNHGFSPMTTQIEVTEWTKEVIIQGQGT